MRLIESINTRRAAMGLVLALATLGIHESGVQEGIAEQKARCSSFLVSTFLRDRQSMAFDDPATERFGDVSLTNVDGRVIAHVTDVGNQEIPTLRGSELSETSPATRIDVGDLHVPDTFLVYATAELPTQNVRVVQYTTQVCRS